MANELPDIPQATLYRNINLLAAAGILIVVQERRVRNTTEKTYALPDQGLFLTMEDLKEAQPEDYIRLFTQYLGQLLGYYARYIQHGHVDFARDNVIFQMFPVYLSEAETQAAGQAINAALLPYLKNEPSPALHRWAHIHPRQHEPPVAAGSQAGPPAVASSEPRLQKKSNKKGSNHGRKR